MGPTLESGVSGEVDEKVDVKRVHFVAEKAWNAQHTVVVASFSDRTDNPK